MTAEIEKYTPQPQHNGSPATETPGSRTGRTTTAHPRELSTRSRSTQRRGEAVHAPDLRFESMPLAQTMFRELSRIDAQPSAFLVRGRAGTGKSALLGAVRDLLVSGNIKVFDDLSTLPKRLLADSGPETAGRRALLIDDAHRLTADDMQTLCAVVGNRRHTVVVAAQPRPHDRDLRTLTEALVRHGRAIELRALGVPELMSFARELGLLVPRPLAEYIHLRTGGIRAGVVAGLRAACSARRDAAVAAVDIAAAGWARTVLADLAPELLDTLVVASAGAGLDASELAEVFDIDFASAQDLVDRARASALVTDADLLLAAAVAPLREQLGAQRFVTVQRRLLTTRLDAGLLRADTAVLFAESGVRDPRLADFLTAAAEHGALAVHHTHEATTPDPARPVLQPAFEPLTSLTEREQQVADLLLLGLTYREIGSRLYISAKTVEHHVSRIRRRIGAGSRTELLSMLSAMGHGPLLVWPPRGPIRIEQDAEART
ncbi:LuxR C-terminal-related transcriptional regulator [Nocardia sp. NPDC059180]|uniref:helix-turn-helix transcriptional regulator n=1 Tax=Nocardia sp. NPDC059180 TaxID=3346761 RepID=UPI0036CD08E6